MLKMISMILVGFINRVTSNELPRIDWGGSGFEKRKKRIAPMPVRLRLKMYIDSFFNGSWKGAIEIRSHCVVAIRGCSLAQAVSFRLEEKGTAKISLLRAREEMIEH